MNFYYKGVSLKDLIYQMERGSIETSEIGRNLFLNKNLFQYKGSSNDQNYRPERDFPEELVDFMVQVIEARKAEEEEPPLEQIINMKLNFQIALLQPETINIQTTPSEYKPYVSKLDQILLSKKDLPSTSTINIEREGVVYTVYREGTNIRIGAVEKVVGSVEKSSPVITRIVTPVNQGYSRINMKYPYYQLSSEIAAFESVLISNRNKLDGNMFTINNIFNQIQLSTIANNVNNQDLSYDVNSSNLDIKFNKEVVNDSMAELILGRLSSGYKSNTNIFGNVYSQIYENIVQRVNQQTLKKPNTGTDNTLQIQPDTVKTFLLTNNIIEV